jgi:hypothetical protein
MNAMKAIKNKPGTIKIVQIIFEILSLQINLVIAANPIRIDHFNNPSICVICSNSASSTQKDILFNELISLAPSTPDEATFSDEVTTMEINLAPTTPAEASFDNDTESISPYVIECLAPTTPPKADFND